MYTSEQVAQSMGGMVPSSRAAAPAKAVDKVAEAEMIANAAADAADRATRAAEEAAITACDRMKRVRPQPR